MIGYKIHEGGERSPAQFGSASEGDLILVEKLKGDQSGRLLRHIAVVEASDKNQIDGQLNVNGSP